MPVVQQILENKATLITEPIADKKTVAIGFWFSVGSRLENEGKHGISHFVEHMLFKGTSTRTCFDIACEFDKMGGYVNAFTEREQLCVYCVVPCSYCIPALKIIQDMIYNSKFLPEEVEKERTVIQSEIISALDDPEEAAMDAVFSSIWKENHIALSIPGSFEDVESLTCEDLYDWYQQFIKNGPMLITVSGNFDCGQVSRVVNEFPFRNNFYKKNEFSKPGWNSAIDFIPADFQQEQFFFLFSVDAPLSLEENIAMSILNAIIGDTMSSRLFQKLREESGYCYNVYSFFTVFEDCGFWANYATSSKKNCLTVARDLLKIVKDFFRTELTQKEIDFAKQHLCGEEIMASEDVEQRIKSLSKSYFSGYNVYESEKIIEIIKKTDTSTLLDILRNFDKKLEYSFVIYGPKVKKSVSQKICKVIEDEFRC
ncbi:MAG: M16 family metallopeptidase [Treponemataceae bacterium]